MANLLSNTTIGGYQSIHTGNIGSYALTSIPATISPTNINIGNAIYFGGGNNYLNWDGARINSNVGIQSTSDLRAPIFYDSADTSYYTDPNDVSQLHITKTALRAHKNMTGYGVGNWISDFSNTPVSSMTFGQDKYDGGPAGTWWFQVNMRHNNGSNLWGTQLAYGWEDNSNEIYQRNVTGGTWSGWVRYINSSNYASILDARYYTESEVNSLLSAKQDSSTAITTSNIGSQSVNFANSSTSAAYLNYTGVGGTQLNANTFSYGRASNYYSTNQILNSPENAYASLYNFGGDTPSALSLQLFASVNHNDTSSTRNLWFRVGNNLGFQNDWKQIIHSGSIGSQSVSYATTAGALSSMNISQFTNNSGYITGYTETDTLASVTGRGATTASQMSFTKTDDHAISVGTIRGRAVGVQSGEFIQLYERVNIGGPNGWGASNTSAPSYGLSVYGGATIGYGNSAGLAVTGRITVQNGNDSGTLYGPNATWGAYLYVGAAGNNVASTTAQVISTDGNLHLDSGSGSKQIYMNYYSGMVTGIYGGLNMQNTYITNASYIRSNTNIYTDQNYGYGLVGLYNSTRYQGVFAMGDSYKLTADGTGTGTLYGLAWTHPNIGGESKAGLSHQLLVMENGNTRTAIGSGIWTAGLITTTSYGTSANWNTAYSWGNHASAGYLTSVPAQSQLISPNGATVVAADSAMPNAGHSFIHSLALGPGGNDGHILGMSWAGTTSVYGAQIFLDTDPNDIMAIRSRSNAGVWTSWKTIYHSGNFTDNSSNWNTAYGWGNHASAGYIVAGSTVSESGSWTGATKFRSSGDISNPGAGNHALHIYSDTNNDAFMAFHISGDYAIYFGLDDATNRLHTGGWSEGAAKYQLWDSRDFTSSNISNWSTAYSWGNHASAGYQSASTAINTGNIGSQSVSYATTAGSAPNGGNVNDFYNVTAGNGYGLRFWNSDNYKISMGSSSLYFYGPVTGYSIKMQMDDGSADRGFTWGRMSYAPIAALNSTSGDMQIAGSFTTTSVNAPSGYVSNGNPWGTANSAYFPNGITTAGNDNWVYGHTYVGNAPGNGAGHEYWSDGSEFHKTTVGTASHGQSGKWLSLQSALGNFIPYSFESERGNHSWGTVARYRINNGESDRPSIQFSWGGSDTRWNVGYCYADDLFRITQNMGYRNDNSTSDGWGTERFRIDTSGNTYAAIGGTLYANGSAVITSANIGSQSVSYASTAGSAPANGGNSSTVGGYSVSVGASANTIPTRNSSGYLIPESWIQLNGTYGLYSPTNNAHLRPNSGSYGSWQMTGSRNGWQGIEFDSGSAGNISLMVAADSNTVGFHNNNYGWQFRWNGGTLYVYKNAYGAGTEATVLDSSNYSSWAQPIASAINTGNIGSQSVSYATTAGTANAVAWGNVSSKPSLLMYYQGFTLDANTMDGNSTGFTYSVNAPFTGPIARFSETGYSLQLNAAYSGSGTGIAFRTRNGDAGSFNPWRVLLNDANYTAYSPSLTGSGASGTWSINVTGSAGSAGSVPASGITGQTGMWVSSNRPGAYRLYRNDSDDPYNVQTTWSADKASHWSLRGYYNDSYHAPCYVASSGFADNAGQLNNVGYLVGDNWDTYYTSGKLRVASAAGATGTGRPPSSVHNYGSLLSYGISGEDMFQMYFPDNAGNSIANSRKLHYRTGRGTWCDWRTVVDMVGDTLTIVEGGTPKIVVRGSVPYGQPTSASIELVGDADGNQTQSYRWISTAPDWGGQEFRLERKVNNAFQLVGRVPKNTNNLEWQGTIVQGLSDSRVKTNVVSMTEGLDKIDRIRPVTFDWVPTENVSDREGADFGFIAQELEEVLPEVVHTRGDGYKTVMYEKVVPVLVQAMKEQQAMIEALRAEIDLLKTK